MKDKFKHKMLILICLLAGGTAFFFVVRTLYVIRNESDVGIILNQIAPAVSQKEIFDKAVVSIPFVCEDVLPDRWVVGITATANSNKTGYLTIQLDGAKEKTVRTDMFNKISGTYLFPLYFDKTKGNDPKIDIKKNIKTLNLKFKGDAGDNPLIYIAEMSKRDKVYYQVDLKPEKGYPVSLPANTAYPRTLVQYKQIGKCDNF